MSLLDQLDPSQDAIRSRRIHGVVPGVITDNRDPDGLGRVKVSFPWMSDETETGWVKMLTPMAGGERGVVFLPETGDEVLVAFEQADINHPYVLGALWNAEQTPPETNADGHNNLRTIRSRSGHTLVFCYDAEGGTEKVELTTNGGHCIRLDDSSGSEKIEITDHTGNNKILIDSAARKIVVEAGTSIEVKAQEVAVEAVSNLTVASNGNLTVEAGGNLTLKGAMVMIN